MCVCVYGCVCVCVCLRIRYVETLHVYEVAAMYNCRGLSCDRVIVKMYTIIYYMALVITIQWLLRNIIYIYICYRFHLATTIS